jgi:hypothetical protein
LLNAETEAGLDFDATPEAFIDAMGFGDGRQAPRGEK